jgi:hypothetical protein
VGLAQVLTELVGDALPREEDGPLGKLELNGRHVVWLLAARGHEPVFAQEIAQLVIPKTKTLGGGALVVARILQGARQQVTFERRDRPAKIVRQGL